VARTLPDLVGSAVAAYATLAVALLLVDAYRPGLALPLGGLAALGACYASTRLLPPTGATGPAVVALLLALGGGIATAGWSGQYLDADLDPGTYANAGLWLIDNGSLRLPLAADVFEATIPGLRFDAGGWSIVGDHLVAQGNHGLPAVLAVGGWLGGPAALLRTNALLGVTAVLACFALARRLVPGWWAVLPPAILVVSQPFLAFTRVTYTEPLAATLALGGLAALAAAARRPRPAALGLAGFVLGAACLSRPDCYFGAIGVAVVAAGAALGESEHRGRVFLAPLVGWAIPAAVATADLRVLSPVYFGDLGREIGAQLVVGAAALVAAAVVVARGRHRRTRTGTAAAVRLGAAAGIATAAAFALLASRPLWLEQHRPEPNPGIAALQAAVGVTIDGTRTYGERSLEWLSWYLGPATVITGLAGLSVLVAFAVARRIEWRGPLAVVLAHTLLFVARPSITPYQPWAARRFVPIVIPGLCIGAAAVAVGLARRGRLGRGAAALLAVFALAWPAAVSGPLFAVREHVPGLAQTRALCAAIGPDAAVLTLDGPTRRLTRSLAAVCPAEVGSVLNRRLEPNSLAAAHRAVARRGYRLVVVASRPGLIPYRGAPPRATTALRFTGWQEALLRAPRREKSWQPAYWVAEIGADGRATSE